MEGYSENWYRQVLVLYLERPPRNSAQLRGFGGALLIQRLEGSRPHRRLCTLNRSEWVQRDQAPAELGRSSLAHGDAPDFKKDLHVLVSPDVAMALLRSAMKAVVRLALVEPRLIADLREC